MNCFPSTMRVHADISFADAPPLNSATASVAAIPVLIALSPLGEAPQTGPFVTQFIR